MTADFQSHQEDARQNTTRLIVLLGAGVAAIIAVVSVLITGLLFYGSGEFQPLAAIAVAAPITTIGVVGTSLVKSSQIRSGGGSYVAASLGGRAVDFNTLDPAEKQLANVVEEIAIASGMPVPAVFVLDDEPGINAFAAGWTADNAAIGVTRGALQHFNRRELQGVIAHEFSHIVNGDTRVKTRIIGWVFGIAVITVLGRILLNSLWWAPRRRDREDNSAMVLLAAGVGLLVIGSLGTLFARMVQAAVSRQREYLADASAVQYTRDPSGIGEALMKIGATTEGSHVRAAHATETSHLFFSTAIGSSLATHPPVAERIRRLVPDWDGEFPSLDPVEQPSDRAGRPQQARGGQPQHRGGRGLLPGMPGIPGVPGSGGLGGMAASGLAGGEARTSNAGASGPGGRPDDRVVAAAMASASERPAQPNFDGPTDAHIEHARGLLARIPEPTQSYLHTRQGAVAAVLGLLVSPEPDLRPQQLADVGRAMGLEPGYLDAAGRVISDLHRSLHLPAIDIALHSIQELPYETKMGLAQTIRAIEHARPHQDLFRWMLRRVILRHIDDQNDDGRRSHDRHLPELEADARTLLAVIAHFNSSGPELAQGSYEAAVRAAGFAPAPLAPIEELTFDRLDDALDRLGELDRAGRQQFVSAATTAVLHDGRTTVEEAELIRVVADAVRQPVPPLISI